MLSKLLIADEDIEFKDKLRGYRKYDVKKFITNNHMRYTCEKFGEKDKRKVVYCVITKKNDDGSLLVKSYDGSFKWNIDPSNKYKKYNFYKKYDLPINPKNNL